MKVGYSSNSYPAERNIINIVKSHSYKRVYDINKILSMASSVINKKLPYISSLISIDRYFKFNDFNLNRVDILHFFNAVSFGKTPWITTFETIIPRFDLTLTCHHGKNCSYSPLKNIKKIQIAIEAMAGDSCKKLISMSECSFKMQKDLLSHFPQYRSEIERKLLYLHPPQKSFIHKYEDKKLDLDGQLHFMFVGGSFFRKGGMEILNTFQEVRNIYGYKIKLSIVSSLSIDNYATKENKEYVNRAQKIIYENSDWIDHYNYLSNQDVIKLMKSVHIGLLPTYADTYGYSVLEFQASGCPVITTNIRALPEINNNETGWLIEIPKNRLGEAIYTSKEDRAKISSIISSELKHIIIEIMENRSVIIHKGNAALRQIKNQHSPEDYAIKIESIYNSSL